MNNVGIISLGHYLPKQQVSNTDLEKIVATSDDWIFTRTGIRNRHVADKNEKNSNMATKAGQQALKDAKLDASKLDLIVVATISPDSSFPSVACLVQKAIHAKNAVAFDISAACSGFLYALITAKQYIHSGLYKNALVIASDKITNLVDWNDRSTCVLFGDGAGACILGKVGKGKGIISEYMHSQGQFGSLMSVISQERAPFNKKSKFLKLPHIVMQGKELFKIAVNSMAEASSIVIKKAGLKLSDIKCLVPHQANDRIITAVAKKLNYPKDKIFINIEKYGNMSSASIAVALYEAVKQGKIKKGDYVVLVTFGAGLVSAASVVKW